MKTMSGNVLLRLLLDEVQFRHQVEQVLANQDEDDCMTTLAFLPFPDARILCPSLGCHHFVGWAHKWVQLSLRLLVQGAYRLRCTHCGMDCDKHHSVRYF